MPDRLSVEELNHMVVTLEQKLNDTLRENERLREALQRSCGYLKTSKNAVKSGAYQQVLDVLSNKDSDNG